MRVDAEAVWACVVLGASLGRPIQYTRCSSIGYCPHKTRINAPPEPWPNSTLRKFDLGNALEPFVLRDFARRYGADTICEQGKVAFIRKGILFIGHYDMLATVNGIKTIVDSKVVSKFAFNKYVDSSGPDRTITAYMAQLGAYCYATDAQQACLAIRNKDTTGEACVWEDHYIWFSRDEVQGAFDSALDALIEDDISDVEPWECRYCRVEYACHKAKIEQPPDHAAYKALELWLDTGDDRHKEHARKLLNEMSTEDRVPFFKHNGTAVRLSWRNGRVTIRKV